MPFKTTLTFLVLAMGMSIAPPAAAKQPVALILNSARACVAASLPRHGGIKPPLRHAGVAPTFRSAGADLKVSATTPGTNSAKPFTQEQVQGLVRDGLGDDSGAKLIEQRGIDFAPSEEYLQTLKAAGASDAFLDALRAAKPPEPVIARKPINQVQVFALLASQVPSHRVAMLVQERGIDFEPTDEYLQEVRVAGGENELISALKSAKVTKSTILDRAAQARQTEVRKHVARGAELAKKGQYPEAEQEYRAALLLEAQNADIYVSLAAALIAQEEWDEAAVASRGALRLNPNNDIAHAALGFALGGKGDWDEEIAEEREALRLNPGNGLAHSSLGAALAWKGDWDGAIAEQREALRLNPSDDMAHVNLGLALGKESDTDGAIAEYREALHINPNNEMAHYSLGFALGSQADWDGAIMEFRAALRINPNNELAHYNLGTAFGSKGNWDGEIAEEREALRLNPKNDKAHSNLGIALLNTGEWDSALEEFHTAYMLNPNDTTYKRNYERLMRQMKK